MMQEHIALGMIIGLITLMSVLTVQVLRLYRREQRRFSLQDAVLNSEAFKSLRRFSETQLQSIRQDDVHVELMSDQDKIEFVAFYFIGASEFIGKQHGLNRRERKMLTIKLLQADLGIAPRDVSRLYAEALKVKQASLDNPIKTGAKALNLWLANRSGQSQFELKQVLV